MILIQKTVFTSLLIFVFLCDSVPQDLDFSMGSKWHLIKTLSDPGDGSGDFYSVKSDKIIMITSDSTIESNRNLCNIWSSETVKSIAYYSFADKTISPSNCKSNIQLSFKLDNNNLFIYYRCKEGCAELYERIQ